MSSSVNMEYEGRDLEVLAQLPNYYDWIVDTFRPWLGGHTLEIGSGIGTVATRIIDNVERLDLVEPSANLAKLMPQVLKANPKVSVITKTLEQCLPQIEDESCDTVIMVNVLEHIEDDRAALIGLHRILKPGGRLLLFVPALQFLFSEIDRMHGHFRRYHIGPLNSLVQKSGFSILNQRYFDLAGVLPWWLIFTVGNRTNFNPKNAGIYDQYAVPATRVFENMISPPFGKNIILIAERPLADV